MACAKQFRIGERPFQSLCDFAEALIAGRPPTPDTGGGRALLFPDLIMGKGPATSQGLLPPLRYLSEDGVFMNLQSFSDQVAGHPEHRLLTTGITDGQ
jgi:hypothetical protein